MVMTKWNYLVEADERIRRLERASRVNGDIKARTEYHRALIQSGDIKKADQIVMDLATSIRETFVRKLSTANPPNYDYHNHSTVTEPHHLKSVPAEWAGQSSAYIDVYSGPSSMGYIGLNVDIRHGLFIITFVPSSIIYHRGVEALFITDDITKALGSKFKKIREMPQYEWLLKGSEKVPHQAK